MSLTFTALDYHRSVTSSVAENGARLARVAITFLTTGHGEAAPAAPVDLGVMFGEVPTVVTGVELDDGVQLVTGKYPNVAGGVVRWRRNARGLYTGAWIFLVCDSGEQPYALRHHFVFEGLAMKLTGSEIR